MAMSPFRITAPAKLNLFLHITGHRPDGYHLLESLTVFTAFGDELEILPTDTLSLNFTGPFAATLESDGKENLVLRAARSLQAKTTYRMGASLTLNKRIPIGAGLGGGSSDAAATIKGLEHLWRISYTPAARAHLAVSLGSDVLACLLDSPGWVTGIGDNVLPVNIPSGGWVILVNPGQPLLTQHVFRNYSQAFTVSVACPKAWDNIAALAAWAAAQHNALEPAAIALMPVIGPMLAAIAGTKNCLLSRMSGSGATCFGLYDNQADAENAATTLQADYANWWVKATQLKGTNHGKA